MHSNTLKNNSKTKKQLEAKKLYEIKYIFLDNIKIK
jgi:hypothetical protein